MPSLLSGRYSAVKVRKILYVTAHRNTPLPHPSGLDSQMSTPPHRTLVKFFGWPQWVSHPVILMGLLNHLQRSLAVTWLHFFIDLQVGHQQQEAILSLM